MYTMLSIVTVRAVIQKPLRPGHGPLVSVVFGVLGSFLVVFCIDSYPPGLILGFVFLFCVSVGRNLPVSNINIPDVVGLQVWQDDFAIISSDTTAALAACKVEFSRVAKMFNAKRQTLRHLAANLLLLSHWQASSSKRRH